MSAEMRLFVVYLGGRVIDGRMGEDHEVVVVVASDPADARKAAKAKWGGHGTAHVDAVQELTVVDGHRIYLRLTRDADNAPIDLTHEP